MFVCYVNIQFTCKKKERGNLCEILNRKPYICQGTITQFNPLVNIERNNTSTVQSIAVTFHQIGFYY